MQEGDFVPGSNPPRLLPTALPLMNLPMSTESGLELEEPVVKSKCAVPGCRPGPRPTLHRIPTKNSRGQADPRREVWLTVCGINPQPQQETSNFRICGKHFDQVCVGMYVLCVSGNVSLEGPMKLKMACNRVLRALICAHQYQTLPVRTCMYSIQLKGED